MAGLGFHDRQRRRSARESSPDSVIFTLESNFSLFSSASASVDRCSFASDAYDRDSLTSELSLQLAGQDGDQKESWSGPDPDPNKVSKAHKHTRLSRKAEKVKVQSEHSDARVEDETLLVDSARSSFSLALKECQDRRSRSEALLLSKLNRRRPASLDLKDVTVFSPRLGNVKKTSVPGRKSSALPSPGTPSYKYGATGMQKGWSSERVPLHNSGGRRPVAAALLPLNNGRTLPSKWEDAERWIFSPVSGDSGDGGVRQSMASQQRRPKSKSGPLGPPGVAYYSLYSPATQMYGAVNMGNFETGSPFSAGVIKTNGLALCSDGDSGTFPVRSEPCMARSVSVHGCTEVLKQSSLPANGTDEKTPGLKDVGTDTSRAASRRDMATQMSPQDSTRSSPRGRASFSPSRVSTPSALSIMDLQSNFSPKSEVRDVQVDEQVTMTRWSKKSKARHGKCSEMVEDWRKKTTGVQYPASDASDSTQSISKVKRDEAKITAWENLQKAKAEAAIRKLEMKLEKKRSSSMEKIMNKLKSAQKRAQQMRSSVLANEAHQVTRNSHRAISFYRTRHISSLSGCFTCHVL